MLEIIAVLSGISLILSVMVPNYVERVDQAKYEKTLKELTAIAQSSTEYFVTKGAWPANISQLAPSFIPAAIPSPFGTPYVIVGANNLVTVSVMIPTGIASKNPLGELRVINNLGTQDQISISKTVPNELTLRLHYG